MNDAELFQELTRAGEAGETLRRALVPALAAAVRRLNNEVADLRSARRAGAGVIIALADQLAHEQARVRRYARVGERIAAELAALGDDGALDHIEDGCTHGGDCQVHPGVGLQHNFDQTMTGGRPKVCCEFHDRGDEPCAPDDRGGYCCDACPTLAGTATAPNPLAGGAPDA